jgi:hypothetical protein
MLENKYDISIWQGATFGLTITVKNSSNVSQNIVGQSARMQIRSTYDANSVVESMTTANGEIVITDGANGTFHIELSADRTANINVDRSVLSTVILSSGDKVKIPRATYVYDLELANNTTVSKIIYGTAYIYGEVTR